MAAGAVALLNHLRSFAGGFPAGAGFAGGGAAGAFGG